MVCTLDSIASDLYGRPEDRKDGNLLMEFTQMEKAWMESSAANEYDPYTCAVKELPFLECLDIAGARTLGGTIANAVNASDVGTADYEENSLAILESVAGIDNRSTILFGAEIECNGKVVGDGVLNSYDVSVLMWYQFKQAPYQILPTDPSVVTTVEGRHDTRFRCDIQESRLDWQLNIGSDYCVNGQSAFALGYEGRRLAALPAPPRSAYLQDAPSRTEWVEAGPSDSAAPSARLGNGIVEPRGNEDRHHHGSHEAHHAHTYEGNPWLPLAEDDHDDDHDDEHHHEEENHHEDKHDATDHVSLAVAHAEHGLARTYQIGTGQFSMAAMDANVTLWASVRGQGCWYKICLPGPLISMELFLLGVWTKQGVPLSMERPPVYNCTSCVPSNAPADRVTIAFKREVPDEDADDCAVVTGGVQQTMAMMGNTATLRQTPASRACPLSVFVWRPSTPGYEFDVNNFPETKNKLEREAEGKTSCHGGVAVLAGSSALDADRGLMQDLTRCGDGSLEPPPPPSPPDYDATCEAADYLTEGMACTPGAVYEPKMRRFDPLEAMSFARSQARANFYPAFLVDAAASRTGASSGVCCLGAYVCVLNATSNSSTCVANVSGSGLTIPPFAPPPMPPPLPPVLPPPSSPPLSPPSLPPPPVVPVQAGSTAIGTAIGIGAPSLLLLGFVFCGMCLFGKNLKTPATCPEQEKCITTKKEPGPSTLAYASMSQKPPAFSFRPVQPNLVARGRKISYSSVPVV